MSSSESVGDVAGTIWTGVDDIQPPGSIGDFAGAIFKIPGIILFVIRDILRDFGS